MLGPRILNRHLIAKFTSNLNSLCMGPNPKIKTDLVYRYYFSHKTAWAHPRNFPVTLECFMAYTVNNLNIEVRTNSVQTFLPRLHGPSMFAVKAKIYGVIYNQPSSIAFDETSSYRSAPKSS